MAIGEERVHILYEAMRDDTTGISRVGMFYANGIIGHSSLSIQTGVGDNASLPNIWVSVVDGNDVVMAAWREDTGLNTALVYAVTDSAWSVEEPERYSTPGMTSLEFISDGDGIQVLFESIILSNEIHSFENGFPIESDKEAITEVDSIKYPN